MIFAKKKKDYLNRLSGKVWLLRFLIRNLLLTFVLLLPNRGVLAQDNSSATNSLMNRVTNRYNFSFLMHLYGGLGRYDNLTLRKGYSDSLRITGAAAKFLHLEYGFKFRSFGITYYWELLGTSDFIYSKVPGYSSGASYTRHGIRTFGELLHKRFHFLPEVGIVFLDEDAIIGDQEGNEPDLYNEERRDASYNYGFSTRLKLIPVKRAGLWLYGRYVHDHLEVRSDNYWVEIHLWAGDLEEFPPDKWKPYLYSGYFNLGVRWTKKTDGRSETFLTLGFAMTAGIF